MSLKLSILYHPVFKDTAWVTIVQGLVILIAFTTSAILARVLGPQGLGDYQLLLAWVAVASIFGLPGMNVVVMKSALKNYDRFYWLALRKSLLFSGVGTILVALVGCVLYFYQGAESKTAIYFLLIAASIPLSGFQNYDSVLVGKRDFRASRLLSLFGAIVSLFFTGGVAWLTRQAEWVFVAYLLSRVAVLALGFFVVQRKLNECTIDHRMELELFAQGWRQTGLAVFLQVASRLDRILLGAIDPVLLGYYYIGALIPKQVANNAKTLLGVLLARWGARKAEVNFKSMKVHGVKFIILGCVAALSVVILLPTIIPLFFGENYLPAVPIGQWFALSLIMSFWFSAYMSYEQFQTNGLYVQKLQIIRTVIFLVLMVILIEKWRVYGVVAAHLISSWVIFGLAYFNFMKNKKNSL